MSQEITANNKRIAKNTLYMYIRMGITMLVQLYTARVVLQVLGVEDYGIYNIVGSVIIAFNYLSVPLGSAIQRFYNFELGRNKLEQLNSVFNHSLFIYLILSVILFLVIEIIGLWFVNNHMQMPQLRMDAAKWAFHFSLICFIVNLCKMPFESLIIAHEKMAFYAYISIVDVLLKLGNVFFLLLIPFDKLKIYSVNQLIIAIVIFTCVYVFCKKKFRYIYIKKVWDKSVFKSLLGFSSWSLFGAIAAMSANQGLNVLLNMFYGVVINAAMGIANQVNNSVSHFVSNFQVAFRPQLIKSYASGDIDYLKTMITRTAKYSYLLLFAIICPLVFNLDFILKIWLVDVPTYTKEFCAFILIYTLLETLSGPMVTVVQATGRIKKYQLIISAVIFMNIILSYFFLELGFPPVIVLQVKCLLDCLYLAIRLVFMRRMVQYSILTFVKEVIIPVITISSVSVVALLIMSYYIELGWVYLILSILLFLIIYIPLCIFWGIKTNERKAIFNIVKSKVNKHG